MMKHDTRVKTHTQKSTKKYTQTTNAPDARAADVAVAEERRAAWLDGLAAERELLLDLVDHAARQTLATLHELAAAPWNPKVP